MESLEGVERFLMSGTRATLLLGDGATLEEETVRAAIEAKKLKFEGLERLEPTGAKQAIVVASPPVT